MKINISRNSEKGCYHFVRFIRSDRRLISSARCVPPEAQYEYVVATIDVKEQKLKLFLGKTLLEVFNYPSR